MLLHAPSLLTRWLAGAIEYPIFARVSGVAGVCIFPHAVTDTKIPPIYLYSCCLNTLYYSSRLLVYTNSSHQ